MKHRIIRTPLSFAVVGLCVYLSASHPAPAADAPGEKTASKAKPLFDGKTLDGWTVTECKVAVEDGCLVLKEGNGLARTNAKYADFMLEMDWKALQAEKWDSGVFVRFDLPLPKGRPWPRQYQINLKQGEEGTLVGVKGAQAKGLARPGEWNHFKLTVRGNVAELEVNGKAAWKTDAVKAAEGYIGLQAEVPLGGAFQFRDLKITELERAKP